MGIFDGILDTISGVFGGFNPLSAVMQLPDLLDQVNGEPNFGFSGDSYGQGSPENFAPPAGFEDAAPVPGDFGQSFDMAPVPVPGGGLLSDISSAASAVGNVAKSLSPVMPFLAGGASYFGQKDTNELMRELANNAQAFSAEQASQAFARSSSFNAAQAELARSFNSAEAEKGRLFASGQADKAMAFSERMADTQWQRGVKDMQAAGLNPMLAYMKGPNSAPAGFSGSSGVASGPVASASSSGASGVVPGVGNAMAAGISSAASAYQVMAEVDKIVQDTARSQAETRNVKETLNLIMDRADLTVAQASQVREDIQRIRAQRDVSLAQIPKIAQEVINLVKSGRHTDAAVDKIGAETALLDMELPGAFAKSKSDMTTYGQQFRPYVSDIGRVSSAFGSWTQGARNLFNMGGK